MTFIDITSARTFAVDLGERALGTLWQAGLGAATPIILTASAGDLQHVNWWQQLGLAVLGALVAALLALVKGVFAGVKTGTASLSATVAQTAVSPGAHAADKTEQPPAPAVADPAPAEEMPAPLTADQLAAAPTDTAAPASTDLSDPTTATSTAVAGDNPIQFAKEQTS